MTATPIPIPTLAPTAPLCQTFIERASQTWRQLGGGWQCGISQGEETLTDNNLLAIQLAHPGEVRTQKFSHHSESRRTGADWEWWLGTPGHWIGLRIQAKKVDVGTGRYLTLDHVSRSGRQIDLLLQNARRDGLWSLYCFYNFSFEPALPATAPCGLNPSKEVFGCSIAPARAIAGVLSRGEDRLTEVIPLCRPWSCLVCCPGYTRDSAFSRRAEALLRAAFAELGEEAYPQALEVPPPYVSAAWHGTSLRQAQAAPDVSHLIVTAQGVEP